VNGIPAKIDRGLVHRACHDGVDFACDGVKRGRAEAFERGQAAARIQFAGAHLGKLELGAGDDLRREPGSETADGLFDDVRCAVDRDVRGRSLPGGNRACEANGDFGTDAGRIAHREGNSGESHVCLRNGN